MPLKPMFLTVAAATALAIAAAVVGALVLAGGSPSAAVTVAAPVSADAAHVPPPAVRTLVVHRGAEPAPSVAGRSMRAQRLSGPLPARPVMGTVVSDANCEPDAAGVSHCRNVVRMPGGRRLTVRHPHRMMEVPCMTPGERVRVVRA